MVGSQQSRQGSAAATPGDRDAGGLHALRLCDGTGLGSYVCLPWRVLASWFGTGGRCIAWRTRALHQRSNRFSSALVRYPMWMLHVRLKLLHQLVARHKHTTARGHLPQNAKVACSKAAELGAGLVETGWRNPIRSQRPYGISRRVPFSNQGQSNSSSVKSASAYVTNSRFC